MSFFMSLACGRNGHRLRLISSAKLLWHKCFKIVNDEPIRPPYPDEKLNLISKRLSLHIMILDGQNAILPRYTSLTGDGNNSWPSVFIQYLAHVDQFALVKNIDSIMGINPCSFCGRIFDRLDNRQRHETNCRLANVDPGCVRKDKLVKIRYKTGPFTANPTIIDELEGIGMHLNADDCRKLIFDHVVVYDSESVLCADLTETGFVFKTKSFEYTDRHKTIMICCADNVVRETLIFTATKMDDERMFHDFILHLLYIREQSEIEMRKRLRKLFRELKKRSQETKSTGQQYWFDRIEKVQKKLDEHCAQLVILAWNSRRYDLTTFGFSSFFSILNNLVGDLFAIKKGTSYLMLKAGNLRFLDWLNFNPTCTLRAHLKSIFPNDKSQQKGYFPYHALNSFDALAKPLPQYEEFFDPNLGMNALDIEHDHYMDQINDGIASCDVLKRMALDEVPKSGRELYNELYQHWFNEGFQTLGDITRAYIRKDVEPLLDAVEVVLEEYRKEQISVFNYLTLSSLSINAAFTYVARNSQDRVFLFANDENCQFRSEVQNSLIGGMSSVLCSRYEVAGETKIREAQFGEFARTTKRIISYDQCQMYTACLQQNMPCSIFALRAADDGFKPRLSGTIRSVEINCNSVD